MVIPPKLTKQQREDGAKKALEARKSRATIKRQIDDGTLTLEELFKIATVHPYANKIKVIDILKSFPGIGEKTATRIMLECEISLKRRLLGLGRKQKLSLLARSELAS